MPRLIDSASDLDQAVKINPVRGRLSVGPLNPAAPRVFRIEIHLGMQDVDAVKSVARPEDFVGIVGVDQLRAAELAASSGDVYCPFR
jgi:hypothetical protein